MDRINIIIADDHAILRDGLASLLKTDKDINIVATVSDGNEVMGQLAAHSVDICLLDINMPGMDGIQTARQIRQNRPDVKIIMLTTYNDREIIAELLQLGVSGYLLKNSDKEELVEAIHKVMKGRHYFSMEVEEIILKGLEEKKPVETAQLTDREREVVQLLAREYTNEMIARELHISYRTVETHRKNIMQKAKAHNLAGLLKFAYSHGLVS